MLIQLLQDVTSGQKSHEIRAGKKSEYKKYSVIEVIPADNMPQNSRIVFWVNQDNWYNDDIGFPIYSEIDFRIVDHFNYVESISSEYIFISDSQDVKALKESITSEEELILMDCDSFFVKVNDGNYESIYGMLGIVPYLDKKVYKIL